MLDLNSFPLDQLFAELTSDGSLARVLELARDEDLGPGGVPGDLTSKVIIEPAKSGSARVMARDTGVVAGVACMPAVLRTFAPGARVDHHIADGKSVGRGDCIATITGPVDQILQAERTLLNLVSRLSGIATRTARFVQLVAGTRAKLLDTRKTTPGLRNLEKYAVRCGGGFCHRLGLFDAVLIKDNHIAHIPLTELATAVRAAADRARTKFPGRARFIELEVDRLDQLTSVLDAGGAGVDIVLLDNMPAPRLREAVALRDRSGVRVELEASGGVNLDTIRAIAETGVDRISVGGLTHQATSLDLGLDID